MLNETLVDFWLRSPHFSASCLLEFNNGLLLRQSSITFAEDYGADLIGSATRSKNKSVYGAPPIILTLIFSISNLLMISFVTPR